MTARPGYLQPISPAHLISGPIPIWAKKLLARPPACLPASVTYIPIPNCQPSYLPRRTPPIRDTLSCIILFNIISLSFRNPLLSKVTQAEAKFIRRFCEYSLRRCHSKGDWSAEWNRLTLKIITLLPLGSLER